MRKRYDLYFAGPLFTMAETNFNNEVISALRELGLAVCNPMEIADEIIGESLSNNKTGSWQPLVRQENLKAITQSKCVVAVIDGPTVDDGTAYECGYAAALNIPVIGLRTDFRTAGNEGIVNLMIGEGVRMVEYAYSRHSDFEFLICRLYEAIEDVFADRPAGAER